MVASSDDHARLYKMYCDLFRNMDDRRLDAMADQYHPDVIVRQFMTRQQRESDQPFFVAQGSTKIIEQMKSRFTRHDATHHMMGNFVAEVTGDEASIESLLRAYHRGTGESAGLYEESLARFESRAVRGTDGAWKIKQLDYIVLIPTGSPKVFGQPFPEIAA